MKGKIKEDRIDNELYGYSINKIPIHKDSELIAKDNVGKEVKYELNYDGYRKFGMFSEKFYKKAKITIE